MDGDGGTAAKLEALEILINFFLRVDRKINVLGGVMVPWLGMWGTLASCLWPNHGLAPLSGAWCMWCTAACCTRHCTIVPPPHDSRLAGLGARVGDRGGVGDESTFWKPFSLPCKGPCKRAIWDKAEISWSAVPLSIVITTRLKSTSRMTNALVRKTAWIGSRGGKVIQQWNVRLPDRALFIPPALLVRDPREISHTSGRCRWTKYGPANGPDPSSEHPLPVVMKYPWHAVPEMWHSAGLEKAAQELETLVLPLSST